MLEVYVAGGEEGMNARPPRFSERLGRAFHVHSSAAGKRRHLHPREFPAHRVDRFEIALGGNRKTGFEDVYPEFDQFARHTQLLGYGHAATGRLFAIPEGRVEDPHAIIHSWKVLQNHYAEGSFNKANLFHSQLRLAGVIIGLMELSTLRVFMSIASERSF